MASHWRAPVGSQDDRPSTRRASPVCSSPATGSARPGCCPTLRRRAARRRAVPRRAAWWRRGCDVQGETLNADEIFERERPRLVGLAYRLLGSLADAEDVVQEAWIRWQRTDVGELERPQAWLTTVTSRLGLDRLRA